MNIALAYINTEDDRLRIAQTNALRALTQFGCNPIIFNGRPRPFLGDMLKAARGLAGKAPSFGWINSDCEIQLNPYFIGDKERVVGLRRVETADSSICGGVDGYIFPCELWDAVYAPDIPKMYVGGTHVDWWITRMAQKIGAYREYVALLHRSHHRIETSAGLSPEGQHNIREFNAWADRNGVKKD